MLANISVCCDANKCAGAVQMFIAACKMLITATIVNSLYNAKTVPQGECRSKMKG